MTKVKKVYSPVDVNLIARLTQQIGGLDLVHGKIWKAPKGLRVEVLFKEPIRGSYRKSHRTPFVVRIPGVLEPVKLSKNSFEFVKGTDLES